MIPRFVAAAILAGVVFSAQQPQIPPEQAEQADESPERAQQQPEPDQPFAPSVDTLNQTEPPTADEQHQRNNLLAELRAKTLEPLLWVTVAIALAAGLQTLIYRAMLVTNREIERAYIDLSHTPEGLTVKAGSAAVTLKLKNNGRTPGDVLGGKVCLAVTNEPPPSLTPLRPVLGIPAALVNPGDSLTWRVELPLDVQLSSYALVLLVGEVDYRDRFGGFHQSGYGRRFTGVAGNNLVFDDSTRGLNYDRPMTKHERRQYGQNTNGHPKKPDRSRRNRASIV